MAFTDPHHLPATPAAEPAPAAPLTAQQLLALQAQSLCTEPPAMPPAMALALSASFGSVEAWRTAAVDCAVTLPGEAGW